MSEDNRQIVPDKQTDLDEHDLKKIVEFEAAGLPGIAQIEENKLARMLDLYLSGKTYYEISNIMHVKRPLVMYLAKRFDWYGMRSEYLREIHDHRASKLVETKLVSQDFMMQLAHFFQRKIGGNIQKYLESGDPEHADRVNMKDVDKYLKTVDILFKLTSQKTPASKSPTVGLNAGDGVIVKKINESTVEITPTAKEHGVGSILKRFAEEKRSKKVEESSDISNKDSQKGESNNENQ